MAGQPKLRQKALTPQARLGQERCLAERSRDRLLGGPAVGGQTRGDSEQNSRIEWLNTTNWRAKPKGAAPANRLPHADTGFVGKLSKLFIGRRKIAAIGW